MEEKLNALKERLGEIADLETANGLLSWDLRTYMPPAGAAARAVTRATLSRLAHEKFTSEEIGRLLDDLAAETSGLPFDDDTASLIRVTRREYERDRRVPSAFVAELTRATGEAMPAWAQARAESSWNKFEPHLVKILELKRRQAEYLGYADHVYDALLDLFEPGLTTRQVTELFAPVRPELVALVRTIGEHKDRVNPAVLHRTYDEAAQWSLTLEALRLIGFDFERGRQDKTVHPFTSGFSNHDVRVTTRVYPDYFPAAFFGSMHEGGHALYELGSPDKFERTPLAGAASLGVHESQSRLWENLVGRSRAFWNFFYPRFRATFPDAADGNDVETLYRAVNRVEPSYIRVEADEVTYNLHIMLRFELERQLIEGTLEARDVPDAWNSAMQDYLGVTPPDLAQGPLQDVHWSSGLFGYFPTYSLGTFFSVLLLNKARESLPGLDAQFERGEYAPLLGWLRENVHAHGRKFTLNELSTRVTGAPLRTEPYLAYLKKKYGEIYGV